MLIGIQADHSVQQILRKRVMSKLKEAWVDLPLINTWADVFDEGISKGTTNWQLYGSRKPGNERYKLSRVCNITVDPADNEIINRDVSVSKLDMSTEIHKLSVRYKSNTLLFMRNDFVDEYVETHLNLYTEQITAMVELRLYSWSKMNYPTSTFQVAEEGVKDELMNSGRVFRKANYKITLADIT